MNFLAHLYLSGTDSDLRVGNFIGDFVKGKNIRSRYESTIAKGIELHRAIDYFTDLHPIVKQSKSRLRPKYRHYSGIIVDIFYDHFLARNWHDYSHRPLADFAEESYGLLLGKDPILPDEVKQMLPYMMRDNWLVNYARIEGIEKALSGMARRTVYVSKMNESVEDLRAYYEDFQTEFREFFPILQNWTAEWIGNYEG